MPLIDYPTRNRIMQLIRDGFNKIIYFTIYNLNAIISK